MRAGLSDDSSTGNANADEGNRHLWVGTLGTTTSNGAGELVVYADWGEVLDQ